jgi:ornithine cyclodeaminase/alanine dehydrogenase-like protein (mu-crystallin family)
MALLLTEADVERVISMDAVIARVEDAMRELGEGGAQNQPRRRVHPPGGRLNVMFATYPGGGRHGLKTYSIGAAGVNFLVLVYRSDDGRLEALIEADLMGAYRTGAASAVAARRLAPPGPVELGVIGTGHQARTQVHALSRVLQLAAVRVHSRTPERREAFAAELVEHFALPARAAATAEEAVRGAGVVVTITSSRDPVLEAGWVSPGALVVAAGCNQPRNAEIPPELVAAAESVVVDQLDAARLESGDLLRAGFDWSRAVELGAVVAGKAEGRRSAGGTVLFESHGLALWDIAAACHVLEEAAGARLGVEVPLFTA